jgi:flagellar biosynthesis GTPase FlhF
MLLRISLIVAILAGLAVGVLNFVKVKDKITDLQTKLQQQTDRADKAEKERDDTKRELTKTKTELTQTQATLKATEEEKQKAVAEASSQQKRADKLNDDLNKTRTERDEAQQELTAYKVSGMTPQQVANANKMIKDLSNNLTGSQEENRLLGQKIRKVENELALYKEPSKTPALPPTLQGKVLVSDPKWQFVVLNVGEDQGVLQSGELLINRGGKLVAKVRISSVQKDRSVANVLPGWQLGEIFEGDMAIPANPAS